MTTSTLAELSAEAYVYFYPLVENLRQVQRYVSTGVGSNPAAPFNSFSHARKLAGPEDTFVTINNDTGYSMAQLDLSVGPVTLQVPDTEDRYYVLQFVDAWTNNIAYVGTRATGNRAGRFLITPPGWDGPVPDGVTRIPASTSVLTIVGRIACTGPDDIPAVVAVQNALTLTQLRLRVRRRSASQPRRPRSPMRCCSGRRPGCGPRCSPPRRRTTRTPSGTPLSAWATRRTAPPRMRT